MVESTKISLEEDVFESDNTIRFVSNVHLYQSFLWNSKVIRTSNLSQSFTFKTKVERKQTKSEERKQSTTEIWNVYTQCWCILENQRNTTLHTLLYYTILCWTVCTVCTVWYAWIKFILSRYSNTLSWENNDKSNQFLFETWMVKSVIFKYPCVNWLRCI